MQSLQTQIADLRHSLEFRQLKSYLQQGFEYRNGEMVKCRGEQVGRSIQIEPEVQELVDMLRSGPYG